MKRRDWMSGLLHAEKMHKEEGGGLGVGIISTGTTNTPLCGCAGRWKKQLTVCPALGIVIL